MTNLNHNFQNNAKSSVKGRIWKKTSSDPKVARSICNQGLSQSIAEVLAGRGVDDAYISDYLDPKIRNLLPDPSRFKDMDVSVSFLCDKIIENAQIGIWSDYDCDGVTSAAVLGRFLKMISVQDFAIKIPDRMTDGYGPNTKGLLEMKSDGIDTICILDSGIVAFDPLKEAKNADLNVIVIDHHMAEENIPDAVGVINANRLDEAPGYEHLCAAGMTFIFCVGMARELTKRGYFDGKNGRPAAVPNLMRLLGIVALGTVADVVPLTTINRAFVMRGLDEINKGSFPGLSALKDVSGLDKYHLVTSKDLGWKFGPRINAAGRIEDAMLGVDLLMEDDPKKAHEKAKHLDGINAQRKSIEEYVTENALIQFSDRKSGKDRNVAIAVVEDAHEGVVGISAGRLREACDCPAIVLTRDHQGLLKGSARSVPGFDIGHAIIGARKQGLIERGGGHGMAGGLTLKESQLKDFESYVNEQIRASEYFINGVTSDYDIALPSEKLTVELIESFSKMEPYGRDNPSPVVMLANAKINDTRVLKDKHIKLTVSSSTASIDVLIWNSVGTEIEQYLVSNKSSRFDFLGEAGINEWRDKKTVQLIASDLRVA